MRSIASLLTLSLQIGPAFGLAFGATRAARADDAAAGARTSSLSWVRLPGAEGCVATQALARAVEERLGRDTFVSAAQADVSVEGRVAPKPGGGWHAVVTVRDGKGAPLGTREVSRDGPTCDALTAPLALVVAVMIDPDAGAGPKPPPKHEDPPPPAPPQIIVQREEVLVPVPAPPEPPAVRFEGSAAATAGVGLLPGAAFGLAAVGMIEPRKLLPIPIIGFGGYWFDDKARGEMGEQIAFSAFVLGSGFCPLFHHARGAHLYACALGQLGMLQSHPSGVSSGPGDATHLIWNGGVDLRATIIVLGPFALRMGVQGVVALLRERFYGQPASPGGPAPELFRMAPVVGTVDLGVGLALP